MAYTPPLDDIRFALDRIAGLSAVEGLEAFSAYDAERGTPILPRVRALQRSRASLPKQFLPKPRAASPESSGAARPCSGILKPCSAFRNGRP